MDMTNLFNALVGMVIGAIGTLGVIWTLEQEKFWALLRPKGRSKNEFKY